MGRVKMRLCGCELEHNSQQLEKHMPNDHDTRLALAEQKLQQHDRMHNETQEAIKTLTEGISQLVKAEIRREQDDEIFNRIFGEIAELKKKQQEHKDMLAAKELESTRQLVNEANAAKSRWFSELLRTGFTIAGALLLYHYFGIK
jgi:uncharacterized membrane protein YccC